MEKEKTVATWERDKAKAAIFKLEQKKRLFNENKNYECAALGREIAE